MPWEEDSRFQVWEVGREEAEKPISSPYLSGDEAEEEGAGLETLEFVIGSWDETLCDLGGPSCGSVG